MAICKNDCRRIKKRTFLILSSVFCENQNLKNRALFKAQTKQGGENTAIFLYVTLLLS